VHADETEAFWRLYTPLSRKRSPLHFYPALSSRDGLQVVRHCSGNDR
jgi:hypothetical protein